MVTQITKGIKISVNTEFEGTYFRNHKLQFAFSYEITIENHSKDSVQLLARHWEIFDSLNELEVVDGEGVVGKKPVLKPGESHTYASGCLLASTHGAMHGWFDMVNFTTGRNFRVLVPAFLLNAPFALN
jgi:ApaG protein